MLPDRHHPRSWRLGIGAAAFAASSISFCRRGTAAPAHPLNTVLQSRQASCAPERPTQWRSSDFLSDCRKLVRCLLSALCKLILQFRILPRELGAFQSTRINQLGFQLRGVPLPTQAPPNQYGSQLLHGFQLEGVQTANAAPLPC